MFYLYFCCTMPPTFQIKDQSNAVSFSWNFYCRDGLGNLLQELSFDACSVKLGFCERSETKALVEQIPKEARSREGLPTA
ncbi:MAG: hypothetical protein Q8J88_11700 [Bacteroidales bacterium]|nr:hypothetical protein [Bacteroidales bacterium]